MQPKYSKGQKVIVVPAKDKGSCPKDCRLEPYEGKTALVTDYYWINIGLDVPKVRYIYRIRLDDGGREVVVHEDEIRAFSGSIRKITWLRKS